VSASEAQLLEGIRRGDARSFAHAYEEWRPRLHSFLFRLLRRGELAEEVLQETWLRLATHAPTLSEDTRLGAWLFTVARNLATSHHRFQALAEAARALFDAEPEEDTAPSPFDDASGRQEAQRLERALATLPVIHREVLLLVGVEGLAHDEAAKILGLRPEALRKRLSRARSALLQALSEERAA
jgi:RNA polymerase sigma-70 factor (ECF subfamily)